MQGDYDDDDDESPCSMLDVWRAMAGQAVHCASEVCSAEYKGAREVLLSVQELELHEVSLRALSALFCNRVPGAFA